MQNVFTIPEINRIAVEKAVARCEKKAAKYGVPFSVSYGNTYAQKVNINELDTINHCWYVADTISVECFDLTINSEIIRKGEYTVVAEIEHLDGGNIVYTFGGEMKPEWAYLKAHCDHCNGNHGQKKTFIVRGNGEEKQIGRTCLKEYCGIDPQAIGWSNDIVNLMYQHDIDHADISKAPHAYPFDEVLANACMIYRKHGYIKVTEYHSSKIRLGDAVAQRVNADECDKAKAQEIIEALKAMSVDDAVKEGMNDIKTFAECNYCKDCHFGFIAYAPVAYERYLERLAERAKRESEKATERQSEYVGEIGKRMTFDIASFKLVTSWETAYGITHLYKFTDTNGNVLVWFASSIFGYWTEDGRHYVPYSDVKQIKATVKDHNERDGVKQTIITRCKVA